MLNVLRSTSSSPISASSHMHLQVDDAENDIFSTPPTTPSISHSFIRSSNIDSTSTGTTPTSKVSGDESPDGTTKQSLSRRGSRPSSLLLGEDSGFKWTGDVQIEAESPDVRRSNVANGGGSKSHAYDDDDKDRQTQSASTPTRLISNSHHTQSPVSQQHEEQQRQQEQRNTPASPEAISHMLQKNHVLDNTNIPSQAGASNGSLTSATTNSTTDTTDTTAASAGSSTVTQRDYPAAAAATPVQHSSHTGHHRYPSVPLKSPCFVHSFLDKGASLADWLKGRHHHSTPGVSSPIPPQTAKPSLSATDASRGNMHITQTRLSHGPYSQAPYPLKPLPQPHGSPGSSVDSEFDDDEEGLSLTRQLAETAVGVREMSRQLGKLFRFT